MERESSRSLVGADTVISTASRIDRSGSESCSCRFNASPSRQRQAGADRFRTRPKAGCVSRHLPSPDRIGEALSHLMRTTRSGTEPRQCRVHSRRQSQHHPGRAGGFGAAAAAPLSPISRSSSPGLTRGPSRRCGKKRTWLGGRVRPGQGNGEGGAKREVGMGGKQKQDGFPRSRQ